jgi:hypothetical protein
MHFSSVVRWACFAFVPVTSPAFGGCASEGPVDGANVDSGSPVGIVQAVAVGEHGGIVELAGGVWQARDALVDAELNAVELLGGDVALAAGSGHVLRRDADGLWSAIDAPPGGSVSALSSTADGLVVAGTADGGLYTLEGGAWVSMDSPLQGTGWINGVDLASRSFGLAVGGTNAMTPGGVVLSFDGSKWQVLRQGEEKPFNEVANPATSLGFFGGYSDYVAGEPLNLSMWNGQQWTAVPVAFWRRFVTAIDAPRPDHALAFTDGGGTQQSGDGGVILAWDGASWKEMGTATELLGTPSGFFGGCTSSDGFAAAVGPGPLIATYEGMAWRVAETTSFADRIPTLHAVACVR